MVVFKCQPSLLSPPMALLSVRGSKGVRMRRVRYRCHWSHLGPATRKQGSLVDLVLDIVYLMDRTGVIPPFLVLNEVLRDGGNNGGMGPGTTWRPFEITEVEYKELVDALSALNITEARQEHPYATFERAIVDEELNKCTSYEAWLRSASQKYHE